MVGRSAVTFIMPDHVHFFAAPELDAKPLCDFMQFWKQWTSKRIARELGIRGRIWQAEFFDHILRSSESYSQKWDYVRDNPLVLGWCETLTNGHSKAKSKTSGCSRDR